MIELHPEILSRNGAPQFAILSYEEYLQVEEMLRGLARNMPNSDPRFGGFRDNLSADELARRQGVKPVERSDDLYGNGDPADWEGFDEALAQSRAGHPVV